jgi:hypothetical protein
MALSNWELMAFNNSGKTCDGTFVAPSGTEIEIYKNKLYVHNAAMWDAEKENHNFTKPIIAAIYEGNMHLAGVQIVTKRGKQDGIYVFVYFSKYNDKTKKSTYRFFAGIGCSAYDDPSKRLAKAMNVDLNKWKPIAFGSGWNGDQEYISMCCEHRTIPKKVKDWEIDATPKNKALESKYVGVAKSTYNDFIKWLKKTVEETCYSGKEAKQWLERVMACSPERCNQGDAFFVGIKNAKTKLGKQNKETMLGKMISAISTAG